MLLLNLSYLFLIEEKEAKLRLKELLNVKSFFTTFSSIILQGFKRDDEPEEDSTGVVLFVHLSILEYRQVLAATLAHFLPPFTSPPVSVRCILVFQLPLSAVHLKSPRLVGIGSTLKQFHAHNQSCPFLHLLPYLQNPPIRLSRMCQARTSPPGSVGNTRGKVPALERISF